MSDMLKLQNYLGHYVGGLLEQNAKAIEGLSEELIHFRPEGPCNSIGFDAWHTAMRRLVGRLIEEERGDL